MLKKALKLRVFVKSILIIVVAISLFFTMNSISVVYATESNDDSNGIVGKENLPEVYSNDDSVTFDFNGGKNLFFEDKLSMDINVISNPSDPTKYAISLDDEFIINATGKTNCIELLGWSKVRPTEDLAYDGSKDDYFSTHPLIDLNNVVPGDTYFALWQIVAPVEVTLNYDPNGGVFPFDANEVVFNKANVSVPKGTSVNVVGCTDKIAANKNDAYFVRNGYKFIGWNTEKDGSGTSYLPTDKIVLNENMTLYAQWEVVSTKPTETTTTDENSNIVNTGDNNNSVLYLGMMLISMAMMIVVYRKKDEI